MSRQTMAIDTLKRAGMEQLTQPEDGKRIDSGPDGRGMQELPAHAEWQRSGRSVRSDIPKNDAKCAFGQHDVVSVQITWQSGTTCSPMFRVEPFKGCHQTQSQT